MWLPLWLILVVSTRAELFETSADVIIDVTYSVVSTRAELFETSADVIIAVTYLVVSTRAELFETSADVDYRCDLF